MHQPTEDEPIEGDDVACVIEPEAFDGAGFAMDLLRELLPYVDPPQHRDPVSGSAQIECNATHAAICKAVRAILRDSLRRLRDAE